MNATTTQFEIGKTYSTRSACDHNCIFSYEILARTNTTVSIEVDGKTVKRKVFILNGSEKFHPLGKYSMAPVITAYRPMKTLTPDQMNDLNHKMNHGIAKTMYGYFEWSESQNLWIRCIDRK